MKSSTLLGMNFRPPTTAAAGSSDTQGIDTAVRGFVRDVGGAAGPSEGVSYRARTRRRRQYVGPRVRLDLSRKAHP